MERIKGRSLSAQIVMGNIRICGRTLRRPAPATVKDVEAEVLRYEEAVSVAAKELRALSVQAGQSVGSWNARIFDVHAMMVEDPEYREQVVGTIRQSGFDAAYSVMLIGERYVSLFDGMEDEYFRARAQDVADITERLLRILLGEAGETAAEAPAIIVTKEITPGELVQQANGSVLGVVTSQGAYYSHASILARSMELPAVAGITVNASMNGHPAILDGVKGVLILDPDEATIEEYTRLLSEREHNKAVLLAGGNAPTVTRTGKHIPLRANIGELSELKTALELGADGIGLLRTEFLFLNAEHLPNEEEQFLFYKKAVEAMSGRKVVIRTLDIGADKPMPYLKQDEEQNPALGCRAIRYALSNPSLLKTQLRAIRRASLYGDVLVLYPMISAEWELTALAAIEEEVEAALIAEGYTLPRAARGIMIETPAAAILSDRLSERVDFLSIGTNDLAQYVLAVDRQNSSLSDYYDPGSEAVLRMISMVIGNAHRKGIPVSVCGELAADATATAKLIEMGVDELSVTPMHLPAVRKAIRDCEA
ncbi:MAG: phosphoenolpyruvate--protein phosphotransferase [Lachnospiraceae bacterium]|nr:phosphoenolpyruvate--protein phosphotransferase [Lachnospiraceae bacterium]